MKSLRTKVATLALSRDSIPSDSEITLVSEEGIPSGPWT